MYSDDQLLNVREVAALTRLSKPTIYKFMAARRFPRQIHLGSNRVVWLRSEVVAWIVHHAAQRERG